VRSTSQTTISTFALGDFYRDKNAFAQKLGQAFQELGFVCLTDHGVPDKTIEDNFQACRAFFALPEETKRRYYDPNRVRARGYTPATDYRAGDSKQFWHFGRELPEGHTKYRDIMPDNFNVSEIVDFNKRGMALFDALDRAGGVVLSALAVFLGQDEKHFADKINFGNSVLRTVYYPPLDDLDPLPLRAAPHEDVNLITLLVGSGDPGLEALTRDGEWIPIETIPGTIVCNIGEMLQRYSNNLLRSTTHRVVNPSGKERLKPRYSSPYFLHPNPDMMLTPLATCITAERPNAYPNPISSHDYMHARHPDGRYDRVPGGAHDAVQAASITRPSPQGLSDHTRT
jgi:isopenicillin N synthase-like dioxygenase